jgi:hypothetical protein
MHECSHADVQVGAPQGKFRAHCAFEMSLAGVQEAARTADAHLDTQTQKRLRT